MVLFRVISINQISFAVISSSSWHPKPRSETLNRLSVVEISMIFDRLQMSHDMWRPTLFRMGFWQTGHSMSPPPFFACIVAERSQSVTVPQRPTLQDPATRPARDGILCWSHPARPAHPAFYIYLSIKRQDPFIFLDRIFYGNEESVKWKLHLSYMSSSSNSVFIFIIWSSYQGTHLGIIDACKDNLGTSTDNLMDILSLLEYRDFNTWWRWVLFSSNSIAQKPRKRLYYPTKRQIAFDQSQ